MASVLLAAGTARSIAAIIKTPPVNEAVSGVFGSISLTAWICLLLPQLITNYKTKSAEGLSMAFLIVWLLGDIANLLGRYILYFLDTFVPSRSVPEGSYAFKLLLTKSALNQALSRLDLPLRLLHSPCTFASPMSSSLPNVSTITL